VVVSLPLKAPAASTQKITPQPSPALKHRAPSTGLAQAWALANRGDITGANAICDSLIQLQPFDPHAHYLKAVLHYAQGLTLQAREALRRVLYLDPLFAVAYAMLSDVCLADDDKACALKACQQGLKATSLQAADQVAPYLNAVTFQELRQHLQDRIVTLNQ